MRYQSLKKTAYAVSPGYRIITIHHDAANSRDKPAPKEARSFIPKGFESSYYSNGDLNEENKPDALLVLKPRMKEDSAEAVMVCEVSFDDAKKYF